MDLFPQVLQAVAVEYGFVLAYMNDGTVRRFDARPLIRAGGVFAPLQDESVFRKTLTVLNDTVAWDISGKRDPADCIDIDPFTIQAMPRIVDPLAG
ncbi:MAG: DUF2442 domain-containing protein [Polyangiaceae bacterium]|nr:DUF2442 domain-containing protein [Polyangiaceae bacterium]